MVEVIGQFRNSVLTDKENTWLLPVEIYVTQEQLVQVLNKSKDGKLKLLVQPI